MNLSKGNIRILKPGVYCSLQDKGRWGFADKGIPRSGFMDLEAAKIANSLLNQDEGLACLEIYMGGAEFFIESGWSQVCFFGAITEIKKNNLQIKSGMVVNLEEGDRVVISSFKSGQWLYMAIKGRFLVPDVLGSKSFFYPVTEKAKFSKGDGIEFESNGFLPTTHSYLRDRLFKSPHLIKVYPGADYEQLEGKERLFAQPFTVSSQQSRMGIMLEEPLKNTMKDPLSSPVFPGTVQLTPGGKLIVMMRDAQVTGGYPRVLEIDERELGKLAQKRPGEKFHFQLVSGI